MGNYGKVGALLAAVTLSACVTGHGGHGGAGLAVDKITVTVQSWGVVRERWSVERRGPDDFVGARNGQSFAISRADFEHVHTLLQPAEHYAGRSLPCKRIMAADAQSGTIAWTRNGADAVSDWTQACAPRRHDDTLANLATAREAVISFQARSASASAAATP